MERVRIDLSGVPETLLWNLGRRAAAARMGRPLLDDPRAVEIVDRLEYDFADSSRGAIWHAVRVATFDKAVRRFLVRHPAGTVVALGEGLETQFWRVDNGHVRWVSVDLPETLTLRRKLLPDGARQQSYAGSALDNGWLDALDPRHPVLVTAQGLFATSNASRSMSSSRESPAGYPPHRLSSTLCPRRCWKWRGGCPTSTATRQPGSGHGCSPRASVAP